MPVFERLEQAMAEAHGGTLTPAQAQALAALARALVAVLEVRESSELVERLREIKTMLEGRDERA